jgi:hypothetical protein
MKPRTSKHGTATFAEHQPEVHRQPQGGQFAEHAVHGPSGTLTSAVVPGFTVELDRIFVASQKF